jgi:phosphoribosylamine---glycine ligase
MSRRAERILVVGGGGREHALCWRIRQDRPAAEILAAPGNGGIGELATLLPIRAGDVDGIVAWCREGRPDLVVVGPDEPLARGLVDALGGLGVPAFGPTAAAARIESSKAWATEVCRAAGLPMPQSHVFDSADAADAFLDEHGTSHVVKADGLALGKGVTVCRSLDECHAAVDRLMRRHELGPAGDRIVLQECLEGPEVSVFAISDGTTARTIGCARDHKRIHDGDRGPNTGGMGAFTPVPDVDAEMLASIESHVISPVLDELRRRGHPFVGFLYAGLMLTADGPRVIEFNSRMGDPEAQVLLPLLRFDLVEAMQRAVQGRLADWAAAPANGAAVCVVLASEGYPGAYAVDRPIHGLDDVSPDILVFHAGTRRVEGGWRTTGGRVLGVTGTGATLGEARERAYGAARAIDFQGRTMRHDIAVGVS